MKKSLIVIDVQNIYTQKGAPLFVDGNKQIIDNINKIIDFAERAGHQIIYVRHVHKKDGSDLGRMFDYLGGAEEPNFIDGSPEVQYDSRLKISARAEHITKNRYSAFVNTGLESLLKTAKASNIIIVGFMTDYCCESTARHAHDLDYFVDFVMDATGCPDASDAVDQALIKKVSAAVLVGGFARVLTTKEFLAQPA